MLTPWSVPAMDDAKYGLSHHFDDLSQQRESSNLGMWIFLATEVMFFSALFFGYALYRTKYPEAFSAGSRLLDVALGTINTAALICSSLTMALAVHAAKFGLNRSAARYLLFTIVLGGVFLGIKGYEYVHKLEEHHFPGIDFRYPGQLAREVELFLVLYFSMTALHALHMLIGIGVLIFLIFRSLQGAFTPGNHNLIENAGLYWHFVDIVWIFLFPLLYLLGRH